MRTLIVLWLSVLVGCSQPGEAGDPAPKPAGDTIACALGGSEAFDDECIVERKSSDVVLHHPDGSFRRFLLDPDGAGLVAADGADISSQRIEGDWLVVSVGGDRYRLPFTPVDDPNG